MGAVALGEGRLPRRYRGWSLLRRSSFGYEGREPLPQKLDFIRLHPKRPGALRSHRKCGKRSQPIRGMH